MQEKPKVLVELGGYLGYSSVLFADAMLNIHGGLFDFFGFCLCGFVRSFN